MKRKLGLLIILAAGLARGATQDGTRIDLSKSRLPSLHLTVEAPRGWSVEWYKSDNAFSVVRIYREASQSREAIVIAASSASGKSQVDAFSATSLESFRASLSASVYRREKNDFWDGAYFEYELSGFPPGLHVEVRNWMMIADGFLVQFQCYFAHDLSISPDARKRDDAVLAQRYLEILRSVVKKPNQ